MRSITVVGLVVLSLLLVAAAWASPKDYQTRPIPMGVSVSTTPSSPYIFAGTAGMRVRAFGLPDWDFILSNNHVMGAVGPTLCPDTAPLLTWILQPGTLDIGYDPGNDPYYLVGFNVLQIPIDFSPGAVNYVDAAVALTHDSLADNVLYGLGYAPTPEVAFAAVGMPVTKSGRTTGVTTGTVESIFTTVNVSYGSGGSCGIARFDLQAVVTPGSFSDAGDSGSVVLETATKKPVGLLFAGSSTHTVINHILFVYYLAGVFPN